MAADFDIRVGRIVYQGSKKIVPKIDGYTTIEVMMKSSPYWELSPYYLHTEGNCILENIWQFSKVYETVPKVKETYSRFDHTVIWEHGDEKHYDIATDTLTDEYLDWRLKGFQNPYAVRYPVGFKHRHSCLFSLLHVTESPLQKLDYVSARKSIYLPLYTNLVKDQSKFTKLLKMLEDGKKLLIVEVDGPHQESLYYYQEKYSVAEDFFINSTVQATNENLKLLLNDPKHPFGHGYCLAAALQGYLLT